MPRNNKDSIHKRFFALLPYLWPALAVAAGLYLLLAPSQPTMVGSSTAQAESDRNEIEQVSLSRMIVPHATRNIEDIRVGDRVLAANPEITEEERATWGEPDWTDWQHVELEMTQADGGVLQIAMIRPREWFALNRVEQGAEIFLNLPEMGAQGPAQVVSISACPQIRSGPGQVVTATFAHPPSTTVLDVTFEDDISSSGLQPPVSRLGVTDNHLFWSSDREDFIAIGEMSIGERVLTYSGETKRIAQKLPRPGPQLVYNLEVYGEHVYFVGEHGLLVHNQYGNDLDAVDVLASNRRTTKNGTFELDRVHWTATHPQGTRQVYQVNRRTDIDWNRVRQGGAQDGIGLTNAEAARKFGLRPELDDGSFATLHHIGQSSRGPIAEASTRYHGLFREGHDSIHQIYGKNKPHPEFPVGEVRRQWQQYDVPDYWKWREQNR